MALMEQLVNPSYGTQAKMFLFLLVRMILLVLYSLFPLARLFQVLVKVCRLLVLELYGGLSLMIVDNVACLK